MKKTLTTAEIRQIGGDLFSNWEGSKNEVKLSGKNLYSLINLKKTLESKLSVIEETLSALAIQYKGQPQPNGAIVIPEDQREAAGKAFAELGDETIELDYSEIIINEKDNLPLPIFEAIFDFVRFEE